ncbi:hypothetical protein ACLI4Z_08315 [Natrialbaceae archaeon A-arb3/5]
MILTAQAVITEWTETALVNVFGIGLLAAVIATLVAFGYRRISRRYAPLGLGVLVGLTVAGLWLNAVAVRQTTVIDETPLFHHATATYFFVAFIVSAVTADGGRRIGDALACEVYGVGRLDDRGEPVSLVRSARLTVSVRLPEMIDDVPGSPTVDALIKRELAGRTMLFPHAISGSRMVSRLERRIEREFDLGCVSASVADDGMIEHLRVGARRTGIGSTLPPETAAIAVCGDTPSCGSVDDPVEVWTDADPPQLVAAGTLRTVANDTATIVVAADVVTDLELDSTAQYRLVATAGTPSDRHKLVSVLQTTEQTIISVTVGSDGPLESEFVGWLPGTPLCLLRDGDAISFPGESNVLEAGDEVYLLGTPAEFDRLEAPTTEST